MGVFRFNTPMINRRGFLQCITAALPTLAGQAQVGNKLPPVRRLTNGPSFHWFGYYDKWQFDPTGRYVLGMEVGFEHRSPAATDVIKIGMVDLQERDRWIELGETRAWNWQQGCMLQFLPGSKTDIIWNDREGDKFVSHILNIKTRKKRTLPAPIYTVSPDGKTAIAPDFRRLNDCRPGYGYTGIPDPNSDQRAPNNAGIWKMDLRSGQQELIVTLADIAKIPYQEKSRPFHNDPEKAKHWFNHLLFSTDGKRFLWLHRWRVFEGLNRQTAARGGFSTRMFTADVNGQDRFVADPYGGTSHFIWRDPNHIAAWAWNPQHNERFYLFKDKTNEITPLAPDVMTLNGHNTYLPRHNNRWILNDTYPDKDRHQHPYLYDTQTNQRYALGHFYSPPEYVGEWRCDTHPRFSPDGKKCVIDSSHEGLGRQMYLIDFSEIVAR
ncbi:MAG: hypothetical protein JNM09_15895 [Blastocatellia bacterium]|nr:hypothetical protein [Blastocatellia bacterium]